MAAEEIEVQRSARTCLQCGKTVLTTSDRARVRCTGCGGEMVEPFAHFEELRGAGGVRREFEVLYYEYDCGRPCTENGCPGHESTQPVGFWLDGVSFYVEGYERGDFPSHDKELNNAVSEAVQTLVDEFGEAP